MHDYICLIDSTSEVPVDIQEYVLSQLPNSRHVVDCSVQAKRLASELDVPVVTFQEVLEGKLG